METIGVLLIGIGLGIALHRLIMALVLEDSPDTMCAYCRWLGKCSRNIGRNEPRLRSSEDYSRGVDK